MKQLVGKEILNDPFMNKGTAFTYEERKKFGLTGLLPTVVRTLEEQVQIEYEKVCQYETDYEKNKYDHDGTDARSIVPLCPAGFGPETG